MKKSIATLLLASLVTVHAATTLEVPEVLRETGATLSSDNGKITFSVRSKTPLTPAQWDAIEAAKPTRLQFHGNALDDAGMARLVRIDPTSVFINENSVLTGPGVAKFGEMKSLTGLATNHSRQATPECKAAFAKHPALESFSTIADFCIEALYAPKLKSVTLEHGAANDVSVASLANHQVLETLSLGRYGGSRLTDAGFASIATLKHLKKLHVFLSAHTYEGGLHLLKNLPELTTLDLIEVELPAGDLQKLKADLPKVKITYVPVTPQTREKREREAAKK
ncbi:MAG: hypothetical protein RL693_2002 [Verrucomicrobiota bacterium]|jgi:hypothetical protein